MQHRFRCLRVAYRIIVRHMVAFQDLRTIVSHLEASVVYVDSIRAYELERKRLTATPGSVPG
jgi:hypothetical protein